MTAPDEVMLGAPVSIAWAGPVNPGDYVCIVSKHAGDDQVGNYSDTAPLNVTVPIRSGPAEIRYTSGAGAKVLARRAITIVSAPISLQAPSETIASSVVTVEWKGPNHPSDYLTIVAKTARDGVVKSTIYTASGSPAKIPAPKVAGECEIRYMSGQNNVVLVRRDILVR